MQCVGDPGGGHRVVDGHNSSGPCGIGHVVGDDDHDNLRGRIA